MPNLREVFLQARDRFNREAAVGLEACIQFSIPDAGDCYLVVSDSKCFLHDGVSAVPTATLIMDFQTLLDVLNGKVNGMQAFMFGRIKARGNFSHAKSVSELFPIKSE